MPANPAALDPKIAALPGVQALEHIVVLMMENRSFDHMLGFLGKPTMAGLSGSERIPDILGVLQPVTQNAQYQSQLNPDPQHDWQDVNQQIFGNQAGTSGGPMMQGFIKDYFSICGDQQQSLNVMNCFNSAKLPILSGLASGFGLCDHWFSSVPGPTLPNRAYVHFGTSFGVLDMSAVIGLGQQKTSIYQRMADAGVPAKLYYSSTSSSFTAILTDQEQFFGTIDEFYNTANASKDDASCTLPSYCFLEPSYSVPDGSNDQANDQHPDNDVRAGEQLILQVYRTIWDNAYLRNNTLLIIVYDEHGGLYDHIVPPAAPPEPVQNSEGFAFNRFGIRVPAVLISPWIDSTTVDPTPYDHASIPSTATRLWIGDPAIKSPAVREQTAATFLGNLSLSAPRAVDPLANFSDASAFKQGLSAALAEPAAMLAMRPMSSLVQVQVNHAAELDKKLPAKLQTGIDASKLRTAGEAGTYIQKVVTAAQSHLAAKKAQEGGA
jgi:phospholipase C